MIPADVTPEDQDRTLAKELKERHERLAVTLLDIGDVVIVTDGDGNVTLSARHRSLGLLHAVIVTDAFGNVTFLNPVAETLTGWTDSDAKNQPIETVFNIVKEVTRTQVDQPVRGVIQDGLTQCLARNTLLIAKDGSERLINDCAAPILGTTGALDGVVLIFRDVTERRRIEHGLEDTGLNCDVVLAKVRESFVVLDEDLRVVSANLAFYKTFGASPEETVGRSFFTLADGQWESPPLRTLLERFLPNAASFKDVEIEPVFPVFGARSMLLNARKLPRPDGRANLILLAIEDVTGRVRMTATLAASEIQSRRLFDAAKDGILILDAETGAIVDANLFLLDLIGYTRAGLLGKKLWEIGLLGDIEASKVSFRELQEKGYVRYEDLPLQTSDDRQIEVEVVSYMYRSGGAMIIQCNIRDVTQRRRAEEELKRAKDAAEEANRVKDRFLANLSHELRTPLTPVLATIAHVEKLPGLPLELYEGLASIRRNVELESRLIDDLLDVTRIARGKLELHQEVLDVHACLRAALEVCQSEIEMKEQEVSMALRAKAHLIWADSARIQQVFWNLIKNAVKFTPARGHISLRSANAGDGRLVIEVIDTGVGIEPMFLPRIFEAFEQGARSVTREHGGLGLGLAIAKMLVELHGGLLTVTSGGKSEGSVFTVEFQTLPPMKTHEPPLDANLDAKGGRSHLLLIEDNFDTRQAIAQLLRSHGFYVRTAANVEKAREALDGEHFNLLISDIGLPDGSGLEIMRYSRDHIGVKGIALSGYGTDDDIRECKEAGFAHHLTKPTNMNTLVDLITRTAC